MRKYKSRTFFQVNKNNNIFKRLPKQNCNFTIEKKIGTRK